MSAPITKTVRKYGNSGGVYLPSSWIGGKVKVELVENPSNPIKDVLEKIDLKHVISAILYGSYARGEYEEGSDVDLLLVVDDDAKLDLPAELSQKYDIQVKTTYSLRNAIAHDPIFYKILKDDAVALINHQFLDNLRNEKPSIKSVESRLGLIESSLSISKELSRLGMAAEIIYPIVMRLKEILILEYFLTNKKYSTKALEKEILDSGITSREFQIIMKAYRAKRDDKVAEKVVLTQPAMEKLIALLEKKFQYVRQKAC